MTSDIKNSYTAADSLPIKLIKDADLVKEISTTKKIPPVHVQFIPTNKCNMKCDFCSCAEDDRKTEMSLLDAATIISTLKDLDTKAVTITGGGEPLMHPAIDIILWLFIDRKIEVGLVTNGLLLHKLSRVVGRLTWCRISNDDARSLKGDYRDHLSRVVSDHRDVDWAFSHVVSPTPDYDEICRVIEFANIYGFTHVRLVADILKPENVNLEAVKQYVHAKGIDDSKVIYQPRNHPAKGSDCYICYLKPIIGADCKVYACCGVQYAFNKPSKKMPQELCLGFVNELPQIIENSYKPLDGKICDKCYYINYNLALKAILGNVSHEKFV
jgi:organic radical activating enzyme